MASVERCLCVSGSNPLRPVLEMWFSMPCVRDAERADRFVARMMKQVKGGIRG